MDTRIVGRPGNAPARYDRYDRIALVTGSDSGIGEAVAVTLADAGFEA